MNRLFLYIISCCLLVNTAIHSQQLPSVSMQPGIPGFLYDLKGDPLVNKYSKVTDGSPFFSDDWLKGKFFSTDGKVYDNLALKINLLENEIHFLNDQSEELVLKTPAKQVILTNILTNQSYTFIQSARLCNANPKIWYQVLDTGKVWLLKTQLKQITEINAYGSATIEEKITSKQSYHIYLNQECIPVKDAKNLWEKLDALHPGFSDKPAVKGTAKKTEEELIRLCRVFNQ